MPPRALISLCVCLWWAATASGDGRIPSPPSAALATTPLHFQSNRGQAPADVRYLARGPRYLLLLNNRGADLLLAGSQKQPTQLQLRLVGASPSVPSAERRLAGKVNYLVGDRQHWRMGIPTFARVRYS